LRTSFNVKPRMTGKLVHKSEMIEWMSVRSLDGWRVVDVGSVNGSSAMLVVSAGICSVIDSIGMYMEDEYISECI